MPLMNRRPRQFKMRLTNNEADQLKTRAHRHELSQADYARILIYGQSSEYGLPSASKLQDIAAKLAGIGNNLNQCQRAINASQSNGTLTAEQFAAMHKAITQGRMAWAEPLSELRGQLAKLKPSEPAGDLPRNEPDDAE